MRRHIGPHSADALHLHPVLGDGLDVRLDDGEPADPMKPGLRSGGWTSSWDMMDIGFWVSPLPPPGPMTLVFDWPERDVTELRVTLDSQEIRDAAARSPRLWEATP